VLRFWKRMEIEWKILLLAAFILVGVVLPVQKFYSDKLKSTLDQSVDSGLEPLLREVLAIDSGILEGAVTSSLSRNRQWQAMIPIIVEEQNRAMMSFSAILSASLLFLAFWSLKRLTRPLRDLAKNADAIGKGLVVKIRTDSGGALGKLERAMESMQEELEKHREKARARGEETAWRDIARVMAHEIKNPLTPIQLTLDRVQEKLENGSMLTKDEIEKLLYRIGTQVNSLERLVNDFRSFAREPEPQIRTLSLRESAESVASGLQDSISFTFTGDSLVEADPYLLERVLLNIWKNSLEAGATVIRVEIENKDVSAEMRIIDNGPGIPKENMERVWIPYMTFKKGGTGLGLPVVKRLLESMHAGVKIDSRTGTDDRGLTTTITFRRAPEEVLSA